MSLWVLRNFHLVIKRGPSVLQHIFGYLKLTIGALEKDVKNVKIWQ